MEEVKKTDKNKPPRDKESPVVKESNQKMKCTKNSDSGDNIESSGSGENIEKITDKSGSSHVNNSEDTFFNESPSDEVGSSLHISPSKIVASSSSGRKLSLRKISLEVSSSLPLEIESDEEDEEDEETKKTETGNETITIANEEEANSEPLISSVVKSMTMEQMKEHITCCLQLNTENKINTKNAFALKLIDCMTLMLKNQEESNFAAMACQLDAGTKIYSQRVDAVHQQVMKLAESCANAERKDSKKKEEEQDEEEEDNNENSNEKERRLKAKKKILAPPEQLKRVLKGKDPRDNFVQLEAKPGSIFNNARRDPRDYLSLTLEKHIPFWRDPNTPDSRDGGTVPYPCQDEMAKLRAEHEKDLEEEDTLNPAKLPSADETTQVPDVDYDNPRPSTSADDDHGHFEDAPEELCGGETASESLEEETEKVANAVKQSDLNIISLAESKMSMEMAGRPSRFDVLKSVFYTEGESEFDYLKMDNINMWTGSTLWKRPQNANAAALKKKAKRKKKEPLEIKYGKEGVKGISKMTSDVVSSKRTIHLSKRTMRNWKTKKVTLPRDINFDPQMFHKLFNVDVKALLENKKDEEDSAKDGDLPNLDNGDEKDDCAEDNDSILDEGNEILPDIISNLVLTDTPPAENCDETSQESFFPAESDPEGVQNDENEEPAGELNKPSTSDGVYEGDNLVPMVKIVQVEPIRYVAKPNRVDFQHLKDVMLEVIKEKMQDKENQQPTAETGETPAQSIVAFKDVLYELFNSNRLHRRTKEDLSVAMAFLCLLTLTNENCFSLTQEGNTGTEDVLISYATNEHI